LIRLLEKTLPQAEAAALTAHLNFCAACRRELQSLERAVPGRAFAPQEPAAGDLPASLVAGMDVWDEFEQAPERSTAVRRRVAAELEPYIGRQAAARLLASVSAGNRDLLTAIEPLLTQFLGCQAASKLVDYIVDTTVDGA
jgi:hypothetical protein